MFPRNENRNEGIFGGYPRNENWNEGTQNLKIPNQTIFFLSDTVWQTVVSFFFICLVELSQWLSD